MGNNILQLLRKSWAIFREEGISSLYCDSIEFIKWKYPAFWYIDYLKSKIVYLKYKIVFGASAPHPYELIHVDAQDISYWVDQTTRTEIDYLKHGSVIIDSDWDEKYMKKSRTRTRFQKLSKSFDEHFCDGVDWENTPIYTYAKNNKGIHPLYEPTSGNLENRLNQLDRLYQKLKTEGYKTQRKLQNQQQQHTVLSERQKDEIPNFAPPEVHEIGISITRSGKLCWFYGGNHRLHLAKILDIDKIPVRVVVRHAKWQRLRQEIAKAESLGDLSKKAKNNLGHPDMEQIVSENRKL